VGAKTATAVRARTVPVMIATGVQLMVGVHPPVSVFVTTRMVAAAAAAPTTRPAALSCRCPKNDDRRQVPTNTNEHRPADSRRRWQLTSTRPSLLRRRLLTAILDQRRPGGAPFSRSDPRNEAWACSASSECSAPTTRSVSTRGSRRGGAGVQGSTLIRVCEPRNSFPTAQARLYLAGCLQVAGGTVERLCTGSRRSDIWSRQ
jgi:hypothetical protein